MVLCIVYLKKKKGKEKKSTINSFFSRLNLFNKGKKENFIKKQNETKLLKFLFISFIPLGQTIYRNYSLNNSIDKLYLLLLDIPILSIIPAYIITYVDDIDNNLKKASSYKIIDGFLLIPIILFFVLNYIRKNIYNFKFSIILIILFFVNIKIYENKNNIQYKIKKHNKKNNINDSIIITLTIYLIYFFINLFYGTKFSNKFELILFIFIYTKVYITYNIIKLNSIC